MRRLVSRLPLVAVVLALALAVSACMQRPGDGQGKAPSPGAFPLTVTDDAGRQVTVSRQPERLISMAPGNTEILFALGLGPRVVGVDKYSDYPADAAKIEQIGSFSKPNVEKVASLKPDLVIGTGMQKQAIEQLEKLNIPVLVLTPRNVDDVLKNIELVGRLTGTEQKAKEVVTDIKGRIDRVTAALSDIPSDKRLRVYYEVYSDPIMTVGPGTLIHQLIELAGGGNIAADADTDYPKFSVEAVVQRNPEIIVFPEFHGTGVLTVDQVKARPGWENIAAVTAGRIYPIDADIISRPGPRIADAVESLARIFYPDRFTK